MYISHSYGKLGCFSLSLILLILPDWMKSTALNISGFSMAITNKAMKMFIMRDAEAAAAAADLASL